MRGPLKPLGSERRIEDGYVVRYVGGFDKATVRPLITTVFVGREGEARGKDTFDRELPTGSAFDGADAWRRWVWLCPVPASVLRSNPFPPAKIEVFLDLLASALLAREPEGRVCCCNERGMNLGLGSLGGSSDRVVTKI